jgi:putative FmdB family regulatory protein
MPLYEYWCDTCGEFRDWRPMSESGEPAPCPSCDQPAQRAISAPNVLAMDSNRRTAHARNERSAHEPQVMKRDQLERSGPRFGHHHHHHGGGRERRPLPLDATEVSKSGRPWMVGH